MPFSPRITYRGFEPSDAIAAHIHKRSRKLDGGRLSVIGCHVVVDSPHHHKSHGRQYAVRVELATPLGEVLVDRPPGDDHEKENIYAAIDAAFEHAFRRLHDLEERTRVAAHRTGPAVVREP
jgi:ribosome-associated translation inhibitor RaiA